MERDYFLDLVSTEKVGDSVWRFGKTKRGHS
jgi:hypothetical protein